MKKEIAYWSEKIDEFSTEIFDNVILFLSGEPNYEIIEIANFSKVNFKCYLTV